MNENDFTATDLFYILPVSLGMGALFAAIQNGDFIPGFLSFSLVFLLSLVLLRIAQKWSGGRKTLGTMIALALFLRIAVGVTLHLVLPLYGHDDEDDRAGYVYTD